MAGTLEAKRRAKFKYYHKVKLRELTQRWVALKGIVGFEAEVARIAAKIEQHYRALMTGERYLSRETMPPKLRSQLESIIEPEFNMESIENVDFNVLLADLKPGARERESEELLARAHAKASPSTERESRPLPEIDEVATVEFWANRILDGLQPNWQELAQFTDNPEFKTKVQDRILELKLEKKLG